MEQAKIDPTLIEEVVCGNPDMAGAKSNPGRQVASQCGMFLGDRRPVPLTSSVSRP